MATLTITDVARMGGLAAAATKTPAQRSEEMRARVKARWDRTPPEARSAFSRRLHAAKRKKKASNGAGFSGK